MREVAQLDDLRRFAVARSLFPPTTLKRALQILEFVQADPIRSPARAQDLTLRHRVKHYRNGDLDRRYATLDLEEDYFINYGFVTRSLHALMHPREGLPRWPAARRRLAEQLLAFVGERGTVHPRDVDRHFAHGTVKNYWGGSSSATTHLLDALHYRGFLRVARREGGVRLYAVREQAPAPPDRAARQARLDALIDVTVRQYAPLPAATLSSLVSRLRYAAPQWSGDRKDALARAKQRLRQARVDGVDWFWPADEPLSRGEPPDTVRLLAPFDPVVWDRRRFELLWGWAYRFEAYTPRVARTRGYYALPLLWGDRVIGWGNLSVAGGKLVSDFGYLDSQPPAGPAFKRELDAELDRVRVFLDR